MASGLILKHKMKIFLIGKNGQLGQAIHTQSPDAGHEIHAFGQEELNIADGDAFSALFKKINPDVVINASAFHVVPQCEEDPEKAFLINAIALKKIAEMCSESNVQLMTYSTDYVFDGTKGTPYLEDDKPNPLQVYGVSKVAGELLAVRYSPTSVVIRTCGVYGGKEGSRSKKGNFILNILNQATSKEEIEVSSEQIVSPTYAEDLAKATLELLNHKDVCGIYHLANEGYCSWAEFATEAIKIKGLPVKIIPVDRGGMAGSLKRPLFSALENTRAARLGIKLPSWQDALKRYINTL